jgi:hypothetical protein
MRLVDREVLESRRRKIVQVLRDALNRRRDVVLLTVAHVAHEQPNARLGPELLQVVVRLRHQLAAVSYKQSPPNEPLGIADRRDGLARPLRVGQESGRISLAAASVPENRAIPLVLRIPSEDLSLTGFGL